MFNLITAAEEYLMTSTTTATSDDAVDKVKSYSEFIDTYGASAVILSVFILIVLAVLAYTLRNNQKTNSQLMKQQEELLNQLLNKAEEKSDGEVVVKEKNIVGMFVETTGNSKKILKDIIDKIDADRVSIYVFHNGVFSSHGLPFFKTSCVDEVIKKNSGVVKKISVHSGLQLELFFNSICELHTNGIVSITNVEAYEEANPVITGMMRSNNVHSGVGVAVYDDDNNISGVLIAEFAEQKDDLSEIQKYLIEKAPLLEPILEQYTKTQINNDKNDN